MNGLEFSSIVRAAEGCGLQFVSPLVSSAVDHPHSIQRQLGRESPLLPGLGYICAGKQMLARLGGVLDLFASILFDPGLPGIWRWQRPELLNMAQQFFAPAKHIPVTVWGHTTCWTDQCIAKAFFDSDFSPPQRLTRRWYGRREPVNLRLDHQTHVSFHPTELAWLVPAGMRPQEIEFAKTRQRDLVFAAPGGRWFDRQPGPNPTYAQPARPASDLFGGTVRERVAPAYPARDLGNWLKLGLHPAIRHRSYDLFVHQDVPRLGTDLGRLTLAPSGAASGIPQQHDSVCAHAILDLSVLKLRRLLPATQYNLSGVHSDELSITFEPQRGLVASIGLKREWFHEGDQRRGLNAGEVIRLEPFLDSSRIACEQ